MAQSPYTVSGKVFDTDGSTTIQGAVVQAKNIRTNEYLPSTAVAVTNSAGEYIIDLANWSTDYQNGDIYKVYVYKPNKFANFEAVIDVSVGSQDQNLTLTAVTYCTPTEVATFLGMDNVFHITSKPNVVDVCELIRDAEDYINDKTGHAWMSVTVTNEYRSSNQGVYTTYSGRPIYLRHRAIKTISAASGDKIEWWSGSEWEDYIATKTEGRNSDWWFEYEQGIFHVFLATAGTREKDFRFTYRYGETSVPQDINQAAKMQTAIFLIQSEDRSVLLPQGEIGGVAYDTRLGQWRAQVETILYRRQEFQVASAENLSEGYY